MEEEDSESATPPNSGVDELRGQISEISRGIHSLTSSLQQMQQQVFTMQSQKGETPREKPKPEISEFELESMSRKEYTDYLLEKIESGMQGKFASVDGHVQELKNSNLRSGFQTQIEKVRSKFEDFDEWQDEMKGLFSNNGNLTVEQLYHLSKAENPDKERKIREERKPKTEKNFLDFGIGGGMMPSRSSKGSDGKRMKSDEAAYAAFEENIADLGEHFR